jgi:UDP-N-acetylmuramoyl-L-alanyl-D-glutamate--2,6-diaminopimelate ligase
MGAIAARYADYAIITNDNPRRENPAQIAADIRAGIELVPAEKRRATFIEELDRRSAIALAVGMAAAGDWIVVAGKGHEEYQLVGDERWPFSDRQVLREEAAATVSNS